ncbi:hypothetical protein C8Q78DRAFT_1059952 [Trametes maxima]|nr:hypothetical protein C8Q78DRAFT_1059952 [Trametes maxima]
MANEQRNTNTNTIPSGGAGAAGDSRNQKLRGAVQVVHGVGENLRGRFMDAVDSSTNTQAGPGDGPRPEVERGRREVEQGMAKLTGGPGVTDAPPRAPQNTSAPLAHEENGLGPTTQSGITAGLNAGPETAVAQGPGQTQYNPSGAGLVGASAFQQGPTNRDFQPGAAVDQPQGAGGTPGPAPDRNTLSSGPQRLG